MPLRLPSPRRRRIWQTTYLVALGALLILSVFAIVIYLPRTSPPPALPSGGSRPPIDFVQIVGFDLIVSYTAPAGSAPDYFDSPECAACPLNLTAGSDWQFALPLTNADTNASHEVTGVELQAPFTVVFTTPTLPATVAAGASVTITVHVVLPSTPGYYFLSGTIDAA